MRRRFPSLSQEAQKTIYRLLSRKEESDAAILTFLENIPREEAVGFLRRLKLNQVGQIVCWVAGGTLLAVAGASALLYQFVPVEPSRRVLSYVPVLLGMVYMGMFVMLGLIRDPYIARKHEILILLAEKEKNPANIGLWLQTLRYVLFQKAALPESIRKKMVAAVTGILQDVSLLEGELLSDTAREDLTWLLQKAHAGPEYVEEPFDEAFVVAGLLALLPSGTTRTLDALTGQLAKKSTSKRIRAVAEEYVLVGKGG